MNVIGTIGSLFVVGSAKSAQKIMFSRAFSTVFYVAYLLIEHRFLFWLNLVVKALYSQVISSLAACSSNSCCNSWHQYGYYNYIFL
ncbi:hypothetical protein DBR97_22040 [Salmonella enterica]|nr:hypothetical protein [Salmonella enterica]EBH7145756.1 hypothetical protein [Salmonella enterica]EBN1372714.1 hypothetical protein [Salmonella enterica]EDL7349335.1 hypothetical protein [Salmonella enterica subsp. enterica serovar Enteritidis]